MIIPFAEAPIEWWYPHFTGTDLCVRTPTDEWFPNGRVYVLKEFCRPDSDIDEYPAEFLKRFVIPEVDGERRKIVASYLGPDSWNNWGDGHTIAGQFQDRVEEYGITLSRASTDREGGWQLIYRMLKSGELVICSDTCPELVNAIPTRLHDPDNAGFFFNIRSANLRSCQRLGIRPPLKAAEWSLDVPKIRKTLSYICRRNRLPLRF